jgi:hypothetical protein
VRQKLVRKGFVVLVGLAAGIVILVSLFTTPATHDVHTPGGTSIRVGIAAPVTRNGPQAGLVSLTPTQSLADVRCQMWHSDPFNRYKSDPCPSDLTLAEDYWPQLAQSPQTLYVGWTVCGTFWYNPNGLQTEYSLFNVEYIGSSRTLTIHCYSARAWIRLPGGAHYARAVPTTALLVVPTNRISPGRLSVVQDDRIEHLLGDETTATQLGIATIDQYAPTGPTAIP